MRHEHARAAAHAPVEDALAVAELERVEQLLKDAARVGLLLRGVCARVRACVCEGERECPCRMAICGAPVR